MRTRRQSPIQSAAGSLAAQASAAVPDVRSHVVVVSRAANLDRPIGSVYPGPNDDDGLRDQTEFAHPLGFFGKSPIHPRHISILHQCQPVGRRHRLGAQRVVLHAFEAAGGAVSRLPDGEFGDLRSPTGRAGCCSWRTERSPKWTFR